VPLRQPQVPRHDAGTEAAVNGGRSVVPVERVAETGSTNADLLEAARRAPADLPFAARALVATRQTAGRGRQGRRWQATPGASLAFSLAWPLPKMDLSGLSLAVGVALAEALDPRPAEPLRIGLKWPNDLWLVGTDERGRKLGGVLIETVPHGDGRVAVIGVGLNLREQVVEGAASGVAWLGEIDPGTQPEPLLDRLLVALAEGLDGFERDGFAAFADRYAARDLLRGRAVVAQASDGDRRGTAAGIAESGELLLRSADGSLHRVGSGEVSIRFATPEARPAAAPC